LGAKKAEGAGGILDVDVIALAECETAGLTGI